MIFWIRWQKEKWILKYIIYYYTCYSHAHTHSFIYIHAHIHLYSLIYIHIPTYTYTYTIMKIPKHSMVLEHMTPTFSSQHFHNRTPRTDAERAQKRASWQLIQKFPPCLAHDPCLAGTKVDEEFYVCLTYDHCLGETKAGPSILTKYVCI